MIIRICQKKQNFVTSSSMNIKFNFNVLESKQIKGSSFSYFSKQKSYDGNGALRMIGSDCKQLEANIDKLLLTFLKTGETNQSKSFEKCRQISALYHQFEDLAL